MTFSYVTQHNDTWFRIARRYGVSTSALFCCNPRLREHAYIYPGQIIQIPLHPEAGYVIQAGDTLPDIAWRLQISPGCLTAANPGVDPLSPCVGQTIKLPAGDGAEIVDTKREYGYVELMEDIRCLRTKYPFLQVKTIGQSVLGRDIPAIRLGSGPKRMHFNGSFHANEWITTLLLMKFIEQYAHAYDHRQLLRGRNVTELFAQTSLWVVPLVNPDGVELVHTGAVPDPVQHKQLVRWNHGSLDFTGWKANIRGVDLNDQFPAYWEEEKQRRAADGPGPRDYTGAHALSEPEARAMADFTSEHDFDMVIAFHTQGQEIYWNYRDMEPPASESIAKRFAKASRYRAIKLHASDAGYKDWFILQFRRPGFTVEAGIGVNPLPLSQFRSAYDDVIGLMLEALVI
ncbi:M14 family zinc carboxypeptidase [Paenibacillus xerothermodurans]|uniref:LysM peptidoglycan-binding domain-containing protein n=1 Tax=Paenibacillus xerothermodurans TaxID=1977292 RepID=A0A2W1N956_PAEXE|nr:M14 family zinc carboxypeptidase [Paenibacillus xerothermodurans]PZE21169.1 LysM peptidoglycan-binding domain-containing protein [Paenibacillus xerothermodurans]